MASQSDREQVSGSLPSEAIETSANLKQCSTNKEMKSSARIPFIEIFRGAGS